MNILSEKMRCHKSREQTTKKKKVKGEEQKLLQMQRDKKKKLANFCSVFCFVLFCASFSSFSFIVESHVDLTITIIKFVDYYHINEIRCDARQGIYFAIFFCFVLYMNEIYRSHLKCMKKMATKN